MLTMALIGAGAVADLHLRSFDVVKGVSLGGLYDVRSDLARAKAEARGVPVFSDPAAAFADPAIDAVLVLTHADTHLALASAALSAGKHVLVEKPVARDAAGIEALAEQARAAGLVCMPNHNYACVPEFRRMKRMVDAGDLGVVRSFFVTYAIPHSEELASRYGGILGEVMVHHSYLSLAILGKPDHVVGGTAKPGWRHHPHEDQAWMTWQYDRGASAHLFASFATDDLSSDPWTCLIKVLGTRGSAVVNWRDAVFHRSIGTHAMAWDQYEESFADAMAVFRDAILHRESPPSTIDDAATAAHIIGAAYRSAASLSVVSRIDADGRTAW